MSELLDRVCSAALAYAEYTVQDENEAAAIRRAVMRVRDDALDSPRLDWLQSQLYNAREGSIGDVALYGNFGPNIAVQVGANPPVVEAEGATLREAIDAARRNALARRT